MDKNYTDLDYRRLAILYLMQDTMRGAFISFCIGITIFNLILLVIGHFL